MDDSEALAVTLNEDLVGLIRQRVADGRYGSADDLIETAVIELLAAEKRLESIPDDILKRLVEKALENPKTYSIEEVRQKLLDHHNRHLNQSGTGKIAS